jgi:predicted GNAT family N-acyltransferase
LNNIIYKRAETNQELRQILELQYANIPSAISKDEKQQEGFVTVHHSFEVLKAMNDKCPHIIAKNNQRVIGYTLCMLKEFKEKIEVLKPMFKNMDKCLNQNQTYVVMGQVCIDKAFRKQGVFRGLYSVVKKQLQTEFDLIITEIDITNTRSLNAHYAIGFKNLYSYRSNQQDWNIIYLDLK